VLVVDAKNGETVWQASGQADGNTASIRGGVVFHKDTIIVPLSASGVAAAVKRAVGPVRGAHIITPASGPRGSFGSTGHTGPPGLRRS